MSKKSKAYEIAVDQYRDFMKNSHTLKITVEQTFDYRYEKVPTGLEKRAVPEQFTMIQMEFVKELNLSTRAKNMVFTIISDLKMNNPLWYFDHLKNTRDGSCIKELRAKGILFKLEDPRIHYVNPDYIRRGTKAAVLCAIQQELSKVPRVSQDNIKNILKIMRIDLDTYDIVSTEKQVINLGKGGS